MLVVVNNFVTSHLHVKLDSSAFVFGMVIKAPAM